MSKNEKHLQNSEKPMKTNGSTHDQKKCHNTEAKMQYRHPPIQEHLVYSHLICVYMHIYT